MIIIMLLLVILITVLLFYKDLQVKLNFNSDRAFTLTLSWLEPFVKALVTLKNSKLFLSLYWFNKLAMERALRNDKGRLFALKLLQSADPKNLLIDLSYGFTDPFSTGIACGVINMTSQLINIEYMNQTPDFTADNDYIYLNASANVNIGFMLLKMLSKQFHNIISRRSIHE